MVTNSRTGGAAGGSVPGVNPFARLALLAQDLRQEAVAVDRQCVRYLHAGGGADGGEEIGAVDEVVVYFAGGGVAGPVGDERHVHAAGGRRAFAAGVRAAFELAT